VPCWGVPDGAPPMRFKLRACDGTSCRMASVLLMAAVEALGARVPCPWGSPGQGVALLLWAAHSSAGRTGRRAHAAGTPLEQRRRRWGPLAAEKPHAAGPTAQLGYSWVPAASVRAPGGSRHRPRDGAHLGGNGAIGVVSGTGYSVSGSSTRAGRLAMVASGHTRMLDALRNSSRMCRDANVYPQQLPWHRGDGPSVRASVGCLAPMRVPTSESLRWQRSPRAGAFPNVAP